MKQTFDLEERVAGFAARAISVCEALPPKMGSAHLRDQLFRSATSVAANYAEASIPESRKDFGSPTDPPLHLGIAANHSDSIQTNRNPFHLHFN